MDGGCGKATGGTRERDGHGHEGPWGGAAVYTRRPKAGVSKVGGGRNIRLDAATLERRVLGLQRKRG